MVTPRQAVLVIELLIGLVVLVGWWLRIRSSGIGVHRIPISGLLIGMVAGACNTLGLDGVGTTAVAYRAFRLVDDERIPGTLQAGFALPALMEALLLTTSLVTHFNSLVLLVIAAAVGARLGANVVTRLRPRAVALGLGTALLIGGGLMLALAVRGRPAGGDDLALHGTPLLVTLAAYLVIGVFSTFGANAYAPCMWIAAQQGMNPAAAVPIVRAAWLSITASAGSVFIHRDRYDRRAAIALAVGGTVGVFVAIATLMIGVRAAFLQWPLALGILVTGVRMIWTARPGRSRAQAV